MNLRKAIALGALALAFSASAFAQDEVAPEATEESAIRPGTAADQSTVWSEPFESDRSIRVITAEEIWRSNASTLPDLLRNEFGVWMTFANYAGGSPILRGVAGNDVLVLLDGIKINNTAYRFGDLEYLSTIDLHMLDRIEIVRGAAGPYAGDTTGPVIRLYSKRDAEPLSPGAGGPAEPVARATYRYGTVDKSSVAHVEAHREMDRYAFGFGLTTRDIGDLKGGGDVGFQRVTAYEEVSGNGLFQYFLSDTQAFELDVQILEQQNATQYDRTESGSHLEFDLDPRKRALFKVSYLDTTSRSWMDRLSASVYLHQQRQRAFQQTTATPELRTQASDNNDVRGLTAQVAVGLGEHHDLRYGLELTEESVSAVRRIIGTLTGEELIRGKDPRRDGQSRDQATLFVEDSWRLSPSITTTLGVRYSSFSVSGQQQTPFALEDLDADDDGLAGYLSLIWRPLEAFRLFASYDRGFRLPGIDEVTGYSPDRPGAGLPNSELVAETSDVYEIGARYGNDRVSVSGALFHKELADAPVLVEVEGPGFPPRPEFELIQTQSLGEAEIDGFNLEFDLYLPLDLTLSGSYFSTSGDDPLTGLPLTGIPPDFGTVGLRWEGSWDWRPWLEAVVRWADDKGDLSPEDELADPISLAAYDVLTIRAGVTLGTRFRLNVSLENPSDEAYRPYGSFLYAPARNLALSGEYVF